MTEKRKLLSLTFALLLLTGCGIGPGTVVRDRFNYTKAISDSWKSQMLVNLVGIRYGEAPIFMDVSSVINQYELETQGNVAASWQSPLRGTGTNNNINANTLALGGSEKYTDRPTITYTPLSGDKFATSLMSPISPNSILLLIQAGFPVDLVFRLAVHSINGIHNGFGGTIRGYSADPQFYRLLEKWAELQASGAIAYRVEKADGEEALTITFKKNVSNEIMSDSAELKRILALDPQATEFKVVNGAVALSNKEVAILGRSMLQIMIDLASYIEVPQAHVLDKRVAPTFKDDTAGVSVPPLIRVRSSREKPADTFASIQYQDYWFWIDNRDLPSKLILSFQMFMFALTETGGKVGVPMVTIPAR
jgi:hypothetical protein